MPLLGEPSGHDPDHARVPAAFGEHDRGVGPGVEPLLRLLRGRQLNAPLLVLPQGIQLVDVGGELLGPGVVAGREHLDPAGRLPHAAGGVEPGREPEGDVLALELRLLVEARKLQELRDPGAAAAPQRLEAVADGDPVFIDERHDVGDRAEGRQADRPQEHLSQSRRDLLGSTGTGGDRPGELEGDARAAEVAERVARAG